MTGGGAAYIFLRDGTSWSQQAKITASDADSSWGQFGFNLGIYGDYAVIGAHNNNDEGTNTGSAYIFYRDGTSWSQQAKLTASDGAAYDSFGHNVGIYGDYAIVGAPYDDDNNESGSGSAYIFTRSGTSWSQQAKLTASDPGNTDHFGFDVAMANYAIVGAYKDDDSGTDRGSVYTFSRSGTTWTQQQNLLVMVSRMICLEAEAAYEGTFIVGAVKMMIKELIEVLIFLLFLILKQPLLETNQDGILILILM